MVRYMRLQQIRNRAQQTVESGPVRAAALSLLLVFGVFTDREPAERHPHPAEQEKLKPRNGDRKVEAEHADHDGAQKHDAQRVGRSEAGPQQ